jgi:hypothetical protein
MDGEELELFERSLRHATATSSGAGLDAALGELGWHDALEVDPRASISLLFTLQGSAGASSAALDHVVGRRLGLGPDTDTGVVLATIDRWEPPGVIDGRTLRVRGIGSAALAERPQALVVATAGRATVAATVPTAALSLRPVHGVDPWLGLHQVTGDDIELVEVPEPLDGEWSEAVADARLALGHELVGTSRTMLELAREHALDRVQFGRPIAAFQAVRHRLAETLVAVETAEAVLHAAWLDGSPQAAAMAKAVAGREARTASKHCQQVLAGIGFTTEHDLHRHIRRALVLNGLFGTAKSITAAFGTDLLAGRRLPPILPL